MAKLTLDLHEIFNKNKKIETALDELISDAVSKKIRTVEIIPGKGSGQLKKRVIRYLQQPNVKNLYHRIENDENNHGRLFVHFRF
jgi:DNA-nicking Smr family endonuclease